MPVLASCCPRSRESLRFSKSRLDLHLFEHRLVRRQRESVVGLLSSCRSHTFTSAAVTRHYYPCRHYRALHLPACMPASPSHAFPDLAHTNLCAMERAIHGCIFSPEAMVKNITNTLPNPHTSNPHTKTHTNDNAVSDNAVSV